MITVYSSTSIFSSTFKNLTLKRRIRMCNTKSSGLFDDVLADPNFGAVLPKYSITDGNLQVNVAFLDYNDASNPSFSSRVRVSIVEDNLGLLEDANRFDHNTKPVVYWDIKPTSFELFDDLLKYPGQILSKELFGMSPEDVRGESHEGLPYLLTWLNNSPFVNRKYDLHSYIAGPNFLHCSTDVDDSEFILQEYSYPHSPMSLNTDPWEFKDKSLPFHYSREFGQTIVELYVGGIDDGSTENGLAFGLGSKNDDSCVQAYEDTPLVIPDKDECIKVGNRLAHVLKDKGFVSFLQEAKNLFGTLYFDVTC